jgi:two-component system response regulator YesN
MLAVIDKNIANPELSLKWIANNIMYMNEDYLGKQFKKEMKENFSDYLRKKKINLAKELLLTQQEKNIYEIFAMLGFNINTRYFSQVFKKQTGLTPSAYRKKHS